MSGCWTCSEFLARRTRKSFRTSRSNTQQKTGILGMASSADAISNPAVETSLRGLASHQYRSTEEQGFRDPVSAYLTCSSPRSISRRRARGTSWCGLGYEASLKRCP